MKSQEYIALYQIQQLNNACVDCEERGIHAKIKYLHRMNIGVLHLLARNKINEGIYFTHKQTVEESMQ
jgi:hypothetical protein